MALIDQLPPVASGYRENYDLSKINWFQVGGVAEIMFRPKTSLELEFFLKNRPKEIPLTVLGVGSNLIVRDGGIKGIVIRMGREFAQIDKIDETTIKAGSAALDVNVALFARDNSIKNLEFLSGIPGTIGGGLKMNAGAYGSDFSNVLIACEGYDLDGNLHKFSNEQMNFTYRKSNLPDENIIFTYAIFRGEKGDQLEIGRNIEEINQKRTETQPIRERTSGSTFKNPKNSPKKAWELIDAAGCRGLRIGDAIMSEKHCNFMINCGHATAKDLEDLGEEVIRRVKENSGILLEWEVKIIGEKVKLN